MNQKEQKSVPVTVELVAAFLAQRCRRDADFRQRFKSDPVAVLQAEMKRQGSKVAWPQKISVAVEENNAQRWVIPIPSEEMVQAFKDSQAQTFSDEQLEQISAGEVASGVALYTILAAIGAAAGLLAGVGIAGAAVGASYAAQEL